MSMTSHPPPPESPRGVNSQFTREDSRKVLRTRMVPTFYDDAMQGSSWQREEIPVLFSLGTTVNPHVDNSSHDFSTTPRSTPPPGANTPSPHASTDPLQINTPPLEASSLSHGSPSTPSSEGPQTPGPVTRPPSPIAAHPRALRRNGAMIFDWADQRKRSSEALDTDRGEGGSNSSGRKRLKRRQNEDVHSLGGSDGILGSGEEPIDLATDRGDGGSKSSSGKRSKRRRGKGVHSAGGPSDEESVDPSPSKRNKLNAKPPLKRKFTPHRPLGVGRSLRRRTPTPQQVWLSTPPSTPESSRARPRRSKRV